MEVPRAGGNEGTKTSIPTIDVARIAQPFEPISGNVRQKTLSVSLP